MPRARVILPRAPTWPSIQPKVIAESRINGGMITSVDPADLEKNQSQSIKNMRIRFDKVSRRSGYELFTPLAPDGARVLKIVTVKDKLGNATTLRFTKDGIYRITAGAWVAVAGTLAGAITDRISVVVVNNDFYFANNGADEIQKINLGANTFADNGNAPKYKYMTGFYERLVGANLRGGSAVQIGWSGQLACGEFNAAVDISAGNVELVESPSDLADHISGVYGITNYLVVPRERSIWVATKNPQPQNPFNFYNAAPGVGTNLPYTVTVWEQGIVFADARTGTVWFYAVGSQPDSIGRPNDKLFSRQLSLVDMDTAFSSYDSVQNEYTLVLPSASGGVFAAWTYNFRTQAWSYDEYPNTVWSLQDFDFASGYITVDELLGTVDALVGTVDGLSPPANLLPTRAFGLTNGDILTEAKADPTIIDDNGTTFQSEWASKNFQMVSDDQAVGFVRIGIQFDVAGTIGFYYAIDGAPFDDELSPPQASFLNIDPTVIDGRTEVFTIPLNIRCRSFKFKLKAANGQYKLVEYEVHVYGMGRSQR